MQFLIFILFFHLPTAVKICNFQYFTCSSTFPLCVVGDVSVTVVMFDQMSCQSSMVEDQVVVYFVTCWSWLNLRKLRNLATQLNYDYDVIHPTNVFLCLAYCSPEVKGLWNFSVLVQSWSDKIESSPDPQNFWKSSISPIQSWSANVKSCIFILPHEAKELLELFCNSPITICWRQNTSRSAFASWGKIVIAFRHFQNLTRKCLLGIRGKTTAGVISSLGESNCLDWSSDKDNTLGLV